MGSRNAQGPHCLCYHITAPVSLFFSLERGGGTKAVVQLVEYLSSMHTVVGSNPSIANISAW